MKPTHLLIVVILILLGIVCLQQCSIKNKNEQIQDYKAIEQFKDNSIDSLKNKLNQTVTENKIAVAASDEIIKSLSEDVFNLKDKDERRVKEVTALVREVQELKLKPPVIKYRDTGSNKPPEFYTNDSLVHKDSVVIPPKSFGDSTQHYVISGTVLLEGVRLDSVVVRDTSSFRFIEQKPKGLLKKLTKPNELVIQNIHTNPYIKTIGIQAITVKPKQSTWNKFIKPALFFVAGAVVVNQLR